MNLQLGKHKIELFDSIDNLPFDRMNAFNKYVMLDAQLGSNVLDFDKILIKAHQFIQAKMNDQAAQELINIRQVVHNILTGTNLKGFAFASMIKTIDDKEIKDYSIGGLGEILNKLSEWGLTGGNVNAATEDLKKK